MLLSRCVSLGVISLAFLSGCPDDPTLDRGADVAVDAADGASGTTDVPADSSGTDAVDVSSELPGSETASSDTVTPDSAGPDVMADISSDAFMPADASDAAPSFDTVDVAPGDVNDAASGTPDVGGDVIEDAGTTDAPGAFDVTSDVPSDLALDATGYDFAGFINKVVGAYADSGQVQDCATAFPPVAVGDPESLQQAVASHIETLTGIAPSAPMDQPCGNPDTNVCANIFQFYVFATNGNLGTALHPCAQELDKVCDPVVQTWTVTDPQSSQHSVVSMSCIMDGKAMGILYIDGFASCSTFSQN